MPQEADLKVAIPFIKERTSCVKYSDTCYSISQAYGVPYTDSNITFEEYELVQLKGKGKVHLTGTTSHAIRVQKCLYTFSDICYPGLPSRLIFYLQVPCGVLKI